MAKKRKRRNRKAKKVITAMIVIAVAILGVWFGKDALVQAPATEPVSGGEVQFHFIDVGQGDAALIRTEWGDILIDAGTLLSQRQSLSRQVS